VPAAASWSSCSQDGENVLNPKPYNAASCCSCSQDGENVLNLKPYNAAS
jgi:hypothetical protein